MGLEVQNEVKAFDAGMWDRCVFGYGACIYGQRKGSGSCGSGLRRLVLGGRRHFGQGKGTGGKMRGAHL